MGRQEATQRLHLATGQLEAMAAAGQLEAVTVGWIRMAPLSKVERLAATSAPAAGT